LFKKDTDFFDYLKTKINTFRGSDDEMRRYKEGLDKRGIHVILDESEFKITVQSHVNQATKLLEAWVTINSDNPSKPTNPGASPAPSASPTPKPTPNPFGGPTTGAGGKPDAGIKIIFMRIL